MRSPKCLATFKDKEKPDEWFCIVLEDMNTIGYTVMNQIDGLTLEQTRNLFVPITKMHGMYWKHECAPFPWHNLPLRNPAARRGLRFAVRRQSGTAGVAEPPRLHQPPVVRHLVRQLPRGARRALGALGRRAAQGQRGRAGAQPAATCRCRTCKLPLAALLLHCARLPAAHCAAVRLHRTSSRFGHERLTIVLAQNLIALVGKLTTCAACDRAQSPGSRMIWKGRSCRRSWRSPRTRRSSSCSARVLRRSWRRALPRCCTATAAATM